MAYILILIAAIDSTVLFWYLISRKPKTKLTRPNYCASVDDKLSFGVKLK